MPHLKRQKAPKTWPIHRKGTAYVVRPKSNLKSGIPLLIVLRDILNIVQNKKEAKKAIHNKSILLNNKLIKDEKICVSLFDIITIVPSKENYKLTLSNNRKFKLEQIDEKQSNTKISKIINKKILKGKKTQLNFNDGRNLLSGIKCKTNDSVLINLKQNKIEKCLELKEKANALIIGGKHAGKTGKINKIDLKKRMIELLLHNQSNVNVLIKHLIIIE